MRAGVDLALGAFGPVSSPPCPPSAGRRGERFEAGERVREVARPGPAHLQAEPRLAAVEGEPGGGVQEPVAQPLGLAARERAAEQQCLRPGKQVVGDQDEREPDGVEIEVAEGEVAQAGVLVAADLVLDAGAPAVAALEQRDVDVLLVGEQDLEAVAVVVCERELGARVGALAADDPARALGPVAALEEVGDLGDLGALARLLVAGQRRRPRSLLQSEDRSADRLGQVEPDRVADPSLAAPVE